MLEDDFVKSTRFVEIDRINYKTFSIEYAKQYQSICSEIDSICKSICSFINSANKPENMREYTNIILNNYNDVIYRKLIVKQNKELLINHFNDWSISPKYKAPSWWGRYNQVKHNRVVNYYDANLENVINSLSALFLLEMYLLKEICKNDENAPDVPNRNSQLFMIQDWKTKCTILGDATIVEF